VRSVKSEVKRYIQLASYNVKPVWNPPMGIRKRCVLPASWITVVVSISMNDLTRVNIDFEITDKNIFILFN
jgi:hypothetical protein